MSVVYNENDRFAAAWLRALIDAEQLPKGVVDERSIEVLEKKDCADTMHFFAGIGGWPYALRLAGWPDDKPVWTGSCPCQPFSAAGKRQGEADERHLWPVWFRLISECRPTTIFGEQVSSPAGRDWLSIVRNQLWSLGYAVAAADLPAASVGLPHRRQRLFFVAHANGERLEGRRLSWGEGEREWVVRPGRDAVRFGDGKWRCIEPGISPVAHGVPGRVGRLRGYGNAIVPQVAAAFIKATGAVDA